MLDTALETTPTGHRLRVARLGTGSPLILLHGYPDNLQIWSRLAPMLSDRFQIIALDWPGMGFSETWPGGATPMDMATRLLRLLDHWRLERADIVAMDMGAQPALVLAAQHPQRVHHLIVMNSLVLWDEQTSWEIRLLRKFGWNLHLLRHWPRIVFGRAYQTSLPSSEALPREIRQDLWEGFRQRDARDYIVRMCAGYQGTLPKLPEYYDQVTSPTLILWGEQDKHFPIAHALRLHKLISGSRLQVLPNGEHWMAWHLAEKVANAINEFTKLGIQTASKKLEREVGRERQLPQ